MNDICIYTINHIVFNNISITAFLFDKSACIDWLMDPVDRSSMFNFSKNPIFTLSLWVHFC